METEALRWFQQVAEGVTVTEVGDLYQVAQSGVSRGLGRLEAEVGAPLLRRSGRTLRMTHAGSVFKKHVDALLNELDDGVAAVSQLVEPETGTVALASQPSLGTWLVPQLISGFRKVHPGVHFVLHQARAELESAVLGGGRVDLEITALRPTDRTVRWHPLLTEPLCVALPSDHRRATQEEMTLDHVADEAFIVLRPASLLRQQGIALCEKAGFRPRVAFEADDLPTVHGLVGAGLGVAIVPAAHHGPSGAAGRGVSHVPIRDPAAVRAVGLAWSTQRRMLPSADLFRRFVIDRAKAGDLPATGPGGAG